MLKLFKKNKKDFSSQMIELIQNVINSRLNIHQKYELIIKKLSKSNRSVNTKLAISRYIMHRILRESDRIFIKAQIEANKLCPCEHRPEKLENSEIKEVITYHWQLNFKLFKKLFTFRVHSKKRKLQFVY